MVSASAGGVTSTEPLSFAVTAGLAGAVVSGLLDPFPPLAAAIMPPTAATPAAAHSQLGLNAQNGVATLLPPNA